MIAINPRPAATGEFAARVAMPKGSWRWQDAWRTTYYRVDLTKDRRPIFRPTGYSRKYAIGPRIGAPKTDIVGSLRRWAPVMIVDDYGDQWVVGVV